MGNTLLIFKNHEYEVEQTAEENGEIILKIKSFLTKKVRIIKVKDRTVHYTIINPDGEVHSTAFQMQPKRFKKFKEQIRKGVDRNHIQSILRILAEEEKKNYEKTEKIVEEIVKYEKDIFGLQGYMVKALRQHLLEEAKRFIYENHTETENNKKNTG